MKPGMSLIKHYLQFKDFRTEEYAYLFARAFANVPGVKEIRGAGLMIGVELDRPCGALLQRAADAGLLVSITADRVIRLVPPLILSRDEAAQIVAILCPLIKAFVSEAQAETKP